VGNEALQFAPGHLHLRQGFLDQLYFRGRRAVQVVSQRNTLAVDHHHPLRALAAFGFADPVAPFLAGAKLPSMKLSLQSSRPRWESDNMGFAIPSFSQIRRKGTREKYLQFVSL